MSPEDYILQLLEQIADEVNVKEVRLVVGDKAFVYRHDTVKQQGIGIDNPLEFVK